MSRGWLRRTRPGTPPLLSVVVPVHDVFGYLAASLDSMLAQDVRDVEIILVDDGSTDGSTALLREYAARHRSLTLVEQSNAGVSVARNVGVDRARGEFLTFADPDDVIPPGAWSRMLAALRRTGSDFAVGSTERVRSTDAGEQRTVPPLMARNHRSERLGIRIEDQPLMLADVFVWNKVFRRDWWVAQGIRFPEGLNYEDQVALTDAFLAADAFDVLTEVVYDWQVRGDLTSATQRRARLSDLDDRIVTKRMTLQRVEAHGCAAVRDTLLTEVLPIDMWEHFRAAVAPATACADDYWELLRRGLLEFWNEATVPFHHTAVPVGQRLMGWLVAQDRRSDLARLVDRIDGPGVPREDGRYLHPWYDEPGLPPELRHV